MFLFWIFFIIRMISSTFHFFVNIKNFRDFCQKIWNDWNDANNARVLEIRRTKTISECVYFQFSASFAWFPALFIFSSIWIISVTFAKNFEMQGTMRITRMSWKFFKPRQTISECVYFQFSASFAWFPTLFVFSSILIISVTFTKEFEMQETMRITRMSWKFVKRRPSQNVFIFSLLHRSHDFQQFSFFRRY